MDLTDAAKRAFSLQDYSPAPAIDGVEVADLKRFTDDGGSFMELGRLSRGLHATFPGFEVKQINYSEMEPGAIKAFHLHQRQTDVWFVPPGDKLLLVLLEKSLDFLRMFEQALPLLFVKRNGKPSQPIN